MGKYKRLLSDTIIFAIGSLGTKLILFFLVPLYTNFLTPEQYGIIELINTIVDLVIPITSLVIFDAVLRFTLDKTKDKNSVILNATIIFVLGSVVAVILTPLLGLYGDMNQWRWYICIYIISCMATQIFLTYIKGKENSKLYVFLSLFQTLLLAVLNIVLLTYYHCGIEGYLFSTILAHVLVAVLALIFGGIFKDIRHATFDKSLLKEMLRYSIPLILNNLSWWIINSSDKFMIDYFVGTEALGLYSIAIKIPSLINVIITLFSQAWTISSIKEYDSTQDNTFYSQIFKFYTFIIFGFCAFLLIIIKPFMRIYVGPEFYSAWQFIPCLLVAACFNAISSYFGSIYGALKKSTNNMFSTLFSGVINIVLNFILIPIIGVMGATIATVIAYIFIAFYRLFDTRRYLKFKIAFVTLFVESILLIIDAYLVTVISTYVAYIVATIFLLGVIACNFDTIKFGVTESVKFLKNRK